MTSPWAALHVLDAGPPAGSRVRLDAGWRETRLVGTIFHELAHEQLYVPGDSEFNEAFASVVEEEGIRRWLVRCGARRRSCMHFELAADARDGVRGLAAGRAGSGSRSCTARALSRANNAGRETARVRAPQVRVRAVAHALGRLRRLRRLVRAIAEQRAPGVGRHVSRLHARTAAELEQAPIRCANSTSTREVRGQTERRHEASSRRRSARRSDSPRLSR